MKTQKTDFKLETVNVSGPAPRFTARSITKDFVCATGMAALAKKSVRKDLVWRHEHPIDLRYKNTHVFGVVVKSEVDNGSIVSEYELYNHTKDHKKLIELLNLRDEIGDPLSISMRFRTYYNEKGDPIHYDVFEHSATPTPACPECIVLDIKNEDEKMPEIELKKQIEELEKQLTKKDELLEDLEKQVGQLKEDVKAKDTSLEDTKSSKDEIVKQLLSFKDKLLEQEKIVAELKESRKMDKLMPIIEKILEHDGKEMKELYVSVAMDKEFDKAKKFLEDRLEKVNKPKIVAAVKSLEETADEAILENKELTPEQEKAIAKKALYHSPELYEKLYGGK